LDYGLYPYGLIHELEVDKKASDRQATAASLVGACIDWLSERHAVVAQYTATTKVDRKLFEDLGFAQESTEMSLRVPPAPVRSSRRTFN